MQQTKNILKRLWDRALLLLTPKNLRLTAMLIAVYQVLTAHLLLFIILLGLAHAMEMKKMLDMDIEDQKEYGIYDLAPFSISNQIRLETASVLANYTAVFFYGATSLACTYVLSSLLLIFGVIKNRKGLILPWLVLEFILIIATSGAVYWCQDEKFVELFGGKNRYFMVGISVVIFDCVVWYFMHLYYQSLRQMSKLTEVATVAIPCPPPGSVPFHFRRENMYLGSNGYKHILSDVPADEPTY